VSRVDAGIGEEEFDALVVNYQRRIYRVLWAVLRDHAARHTLAGGHVVDPFAPRRGRRQPARLAALQALATADPAQALVRLLAVEGVVDLAQFALARNLASSELDRLTRLFQDIPLDCVSTSMTINATAAVLLAMYVVVGEEHGVARADDVLFAVLEPDGAISVVRDDDITPGDRPHRRIKSLRRNQ